MDIPSLWIRGVDPRLLIFPSRSKFQHISLSMCVEIVHLNFKIYMEMQRSKNSEDKLEILLTPNTNKFKEL